MQQISRRDKISMQQVSRTKISMCNKFNEQNKFHWGEKPIYKFHEEKNQHGSKFHEAKFSTHKKFHKQKSARNKFHELSQFQEQ